MTKVLYVEDNDDNVYMLKMRLELRSPQGAMSSIQSPSSWSVLLRRFGGFVR